jgi:outer membrane lipoprotein SlyB
MEGVEGFVNLQSITVILFAAGIAGGCATPDARYGNGDYGYGSTHSNEGYYGVIESIESGPARNDANAIAGTIVGGVVGAVVGHQIGSGRGNDAATVAGALGGAVVGHEIGKASPPPKVYFIRVRFDDQTYQTVAQASLDGLRVGESVRIEGERVRHY